MRVSKTVILHLAFSLFLSLPIFVHADGDLTVNSLTVESNSIFKGNVIICENSEISAAATGGAITNYWSDGTNYAAHLFTSVGTSTFTVASGSLTCDVLVVAGGGGGGHNRGGAGGAGGLIYTSLIVTAASYSITVGDGGAGSAVSDGVIGGHGSNSVFGSITAIGGGGGGSPGDIVGASGGSGGGGCYNANGGGGSNGQGNAGGSAVESGPNNYATGGGGGAGGAGANAIITQGGAGGVGLAYSISGSNVYYAGGGGGGGQGTGLPGSGGNGGGGNGGSPGSDGVANSGGGGGGSFWDSQNRAGGNGGSGIVIVRYRILSSSSNNASTLTLSTSGINQTEAAGTNIFMAKVGLGTNAPAEQLHVRGNFRVDGTNIVTALQLGNGEPRTEWPPSGDGSLTWSGSNQWDNSTKAVARTNLGLGTAATLDSSAFASSSDLSTHLGDTGNPHVVNAAQVGALSTSGNLSELANAATARSNLGLGSAATLNATNFLTPNGGVINGTLSTIAPCGDIPVGVYTNY